MRAKRRVVFLGLLGSLVSGLLIGLTFSSPLALTVVCALAAASPMFFVFYWVQIDRRERGLRRSYGFNVWLANFTVFALPMYLWQTRPALRCVGVLLGFFAALMLAYLLLAVGSLLGAIMQLAASAALQNH